MAEKRILTIDRSKWRRGGSTNWAECGYTRMLNDKGLMCCLGFDAIACGFTAGQILNAVDPESLSMRGLDLPLSYLNGRFAGRKQTAAVEAAIRDNDADNITEAQRERLIRLDLMALGWDDVVFIDGETPSEDARLTPVDQGTAIGSAPDRSGTKR